MMIIDVEVPRRPCFYCKKICEFMVHDTIKDNWLCMECIEENDYDETDGKLQ